MSVLFTVLVTFFAGMGAGLGTGFAGKRTGVHGGGQLDRQ